MRLAVSQTLQPRSSTPFSYELDMSGDTTTVKCRGRIVSETAPELKQLVKPMIPKCRRIVLDLSDVDHIDSSGLGTLVGLKVSAAAAAYCSLQFVNLTPHVKDLFRLTKRGPVLGAPSHVKIFLPHRAKSSSDFRLPE